MSLMNTTFSFEINSQNDVNETGMNENNTFVSLLSTVFNASAPGAGLTTLSPASLARKAARARMMELMVSTYIKFYWYYRTIVFRFYCLT